MVIVCPYLISRNGLFPPVGVFIMGKICLFAHRGQGQGQNASPLRAHVGWRPRGGEEDGTDKVEVFDQ